MQKYNKELWAFTAKNIEDELPWHILCADLISLCSIADGAGKDYKLWTMTFVDSATS